MTAITELDRLERMLKARRFEERLIVESERVTGIFHVGIGQEATAAAIAELRQPDDVLMLNHRNHEHLVANGSSSAMLFAEIFGLDSGPMHGRSGTLHLCDPDCGVPYTSAMVAGSTPLGLGYALARKRQGRHGVAFCCFGDGAMGEGVLQECFNIARLWNLPVVFVCESNTEPGAEQANATHSARAISDIPEAYRIPSVLAEAWKPEEIAAVLADAARQARDGGGPQYVLAQTVPWPGNAGFFYPKLVDGPLVVMRATNSPTGWEQFDPVLNEARRLLDLGVSLDAIIKIDVEVQQEVDAAAQSAIAMPLAPLPAAYDDVWSLR